MNQFSNSDLTGETSPSTVLCSEWNAWADAYVELQAGCHHTKNMLWHYAPWSYLSSMVESGVLLPSNAMAPQQTPMLWFSANQKWEPTATKAMGDSTGRIFQITFNQQVEFSGCIRFGIASNDPRLLKWKDACAVANTTSHMRGCLEKAGMQMGGNPAHWFGTPASMPLSELLLQVWVGHWAYATSPQDMVTAWKEMRKRHSTNDSETTKRPRVK